METEVTIVNLEVDRLKPHPLNRCFPREGPEWEDFVSSVRRKGVEVPLHVREMEGGWEILSGHRRHAAAVAGGRKLVPAMVRTMDDADAVEFLVTENLERLDLSPADAARMLAAMRDELGMGAEEISRRIHRTVDWVGQRQGVLDLGDEVVAAVAAADPERRLAMGSVAEILRVEPELRGSAVQMVLHPVFQVSPLSPRQAREILREHLVEPALAARAWDGGREELGKEWRKRLKETLGAVEADGLLVVVCEYANRERESMGGVDAETQVPCHEKTDEAPDHLPWLRLAARHGLGVKIVPGADDGESRALVAANLLRVAEAARAEAGEETWLAPASGSPRAEPAAEDDGEDDGAREVVEQRVEHHAWVDLTDVHRLKEWAATADGDAAAPEWAPEWVNSYYLEDVAAVCDWMLGLARND